MTKVFNKRNAKRITAILLAVIAVVSSILIIPANAAGKEVTITFDYCYDTGDNIITFVKYTEHGGYTVGTVGEELCRIYADGKGRKLLILPFFSESQETAPVLSEQTVRSGSQLSWLYGNSAQAAVTLLRSSSAIPSLLTELPQATTIRT